MTPGPNQVDLVSGAEPEPSPEESLGLQSSGSYLLCLSCSLTSGLPLA